MRLWKKVSLSAMVLLLLLVIAAGWLVATSSGLHLLGKAVDRWVPGVEIESVSGGWRDLTINSVHVATPGVTVNVGQIHLAANLQCLWRSRLCVSDLALRDIAIAVDTQKIPPARPTAQEEKPLNLALPWPLDVSHLTLHNVHLAIDNTAIALADLSSGFSWQENNLTLTPTLLQQGALTLAPSAQKPPATPVVTQPTSPAETLSALFAQPLLPEWQDIHWPLNLDIQSFRGEQLRLKGENAITLYSLQLKASSRDGEVKLDTLDIDSDYGKIAASGRTQLQGEWPVDLTLKGTLHHDALPEQRVNLQVSGALRNKLQLALNGAGAMTMQLEGEVGLAEAGVPLNLVLKSQHLYWPLQGEKEIQADNLQFAVHGKLMDYTLALTTAIQGASLPPATLSLHAKGNQQQINLDKLTLTALQGKTELQALVDWQRALSWRGELTVSGVNTAKILPDWPARLNGRLTTHGSLYGGSWQVAVPEIVLTGNLKQENIDIRGSLQGNSYMQWQTPGLHLMVGKNRAEIQGELGVKNLHLDALIDAPRLGSILPDVAGAVKGNLKVRGTVEAPQWLADITAHALRWQEWAIGQLTLNGEINSRAPIAGNLNMRAEQISQPGMRISLLQLAAKGSEKQHNLTLNMQGEPLSGQLTLAGSFDRQQERWQGTLSDTHVQTPIGPIALTHNIALDYHYPDPSISIGAHCWRHSDAELCVPQPIAVGTVGKAVVNLNYLNLAMLKAWLPPQTQASGVLSGHAAFNWDSSQGTLPEGKVTLRGQNVKVSQAIDETPLPIAFDILNLTAALHNNRAQLDWLLRLTNQSQLDGQIQISDPQGRRHLVGTMNISHIALAMINPLFARGEKAQGELNGHLRLAGSMKYPQLYGQILLSDAEIDGNFMPFDMQPSQLAVNFNGDHSTLQGTINTQQGEIALSGNADWAQVDNWRAQIAATGHQVRITVPPMVRLDVSPDIMFTATPELLSLDGRIDIPWARIVVNEVPESAVAVSGDEVMLDKNLQPVQSQHTSIPINSSLTLHVGNDVHLDAFGLKARLTGDLQVSQDKQGLGLNGQITIPQGRFHAYGQDLLVRKGELLFSGPPEQPMLNIEAIRNPDATEDGVIAGVRVTGSADQPKAEIFSDPAMSQQQALSYLLRGQKLGSEQSDGAAMTSMLVGLGVAQSGQIVGKIGETFGVSNLALDTEGVGNASQVVVSGYVLPNLQVKYGVGIFDSLATLTLRYRLMPRLYLEAISGVNQALDLLYQFEF